VQQTIEARLAEKALEPQALVIVTKTAANTVTVAGEASLAKEAAIAGDGCNSPPFAELRRGTAGDGTFQSWCKNPALAGGRQAARGDCRR
jgi:hypothetical protein